MITFNELFSGFIVGIIDAYGAIDSKFVSLSDEFPSHERLYPGNFFKRWRWTYSDGIQKSPLSSDFDAEDWDKIKPYKWIISYRKDFDSFYVRRAKDKIYLHRFILNLIDPKIKGDHKDHNGLNCKKNNLRQCTNSQNIMNSKNRKNTTSKYKGVSYNKQYKGWVAKIKDIHIGLFKHEINAAKAYNEKAKELFGEFAYLNIILNDTIFPKEREYTSKYKGVHYRKDTNMYSAEIIINKKKMKLGCFKNEIDAALEYNKIILKFNLSSKKLNEISI